MSYSFTNLTNYIYFESCEDVLARILSRKCKC